jgi:kinesin family protein 15
LLDNIFSLYSGTSTSNDKSGVRVVVRIRPFSEREQNTGNARSILTVDPVSHKTLQLDVRPTPKSFTFDYVAGSEIDQTEMFERCGRPIVDSCLSGYNGTIFCYGQTGSGKTYTMTGAGEGNVHRGLIPRILDNLFQSIDERSSNSTISFDISCSFLEIYNEKLADLLGNNTGKPSNSTSLALREDIKNGVYVEDLTQKTIRTTSEAMTLLKKGLGNRHTGATAMNEHSSRSHSVFTITIKSKETENGVVKLRNSRLNLIDLAGSERQQSTGAEGERLTEACSINKSLSVLGKVIMSLVEKANGKSSHVHYRDSKLTFLLKDSLGGNSKTCIVANCSPATNSMSETLSTLQFAARAKFIKNQPMVNEDTSAQTMQVLQNQIANLTRQLHEERSKKAQTVGGTKTSGDDSKLRGVIQDLEENLLQTMNRLASKEDERAALEERLKEKDRIIEAKETLLETTRAALRMASNSRKEQGRRVRSAPTSLNPLDLDSDIGMEEGEGKQLYDDVMFGADDDSDEDENKLDKLIQSVLNPEQNPAVISMAVKVSDLEKQVSQYEKKFGGKLKTEQKIEENTSKLEVQLAKLHQQNKALEQQLSIVMNQSRGSSRGQNRENLEEELEMVRKSENEAWEKYEIQKRENDRLHEEEIPRLQLGFEQDTESLRKQVESLHNELEHTRNETSQALAQAKATLETETKALKKQYAESIEAQDAKHQQDIASLQEQQTALAEQFERERQISQRQHQAEITSLQNDLEKVIDEAQRLQDCNKTQADELVQLRDSDKRNVAQIENLKEAEREQKLVTEEFKARLEESEQQCAQISQAGEKILLENEKLAQHKDQLEKQLQESHTFLEYQNKARLKLQEDLKNSQDENIQLFSQVEEEREKLTQVERQVAQLSHELNEKIQQNHALEEQLQARITEVATCRAEIEVLQRSEQLYKETLVAREQEITTLTDNNKVLVDKVVAAENREKENYALIQEAEQFKLQKKEHIRKLNTLTILETQNTTLRTELDKSKQHCNGLEGALRTEVATRKKSQEAELNIREKFHQQTTIASKYKEKYEAELEKNEALAKDHEKMQGHIFGIKGREEEAKQHFKDLYEKKILELQTENNSLSSQLSLVKQKYEAAEKDNADLVGNNNSKQRIKHFHKSKEENAVLFNENLALKNQIAELTVQLQRPRLGNSQKTNSRPASVDLKGDGMKLEITEDKENYQTLQNKYETVTQQVAALLDSARKVSKGYKRRKIVADTQNDDPLSMCSAIGAILDSIEIQAPGKELAQSPSRKSFR